MTVQEEIKVIRTQLKKLCPTLSVKARTGTAFGNVAIRGSGEYGDFTDRERNVLILLGLSPGGNHCVILAEDRTKWFFKLSNMNIRIRHKRNIPHQIDEVLNKILNCKL